MYGPYITPESTHIVYADLVAGFVTGIVTGIVTGALFPLVSLELPC